MKQKGITIWEQHIEHIVLLGALVFFGVFAALQFLGKPNSVETRTDGEIAPSEVDGLLEETATKLQNRLKPDASAPFKIPDHDPVLAVFKDELQASIATGPIVPSERRVVLLEGFGGGGGLDAIYHEPSIAAPHAVVAEQYFDAIQPEVVEMHASLQDALPEAPHDLTWITTAARFDLNAVWDQLRADGPGDVRAIPINWYDNEITVLDVRIEREERVDDAWTNRTLLDPIPGQFSTRARLDGAADRSVRKVVMASVTAPGAMEQVLRPPFLGTENDTWVPPDPRLDRSQPMRRLTEEEQEIRKLERQLARVSGKRAQRMTQLKELGGSERDLDQRKNDETTGNRNDRDQGRQRGRSNRRTPGSQGGDSGGGLAGGTTGGGGFSGSGGQGTGGPADPKQIERIADNIRRLDRQLATIGGKLSALRGEDIDPAAMTGAGFGDLSSEEVVIWGHDIAIEPDREYRYRFTIELYNPFFGHTLDLQESQHALAEPLTITSATSEWSTGVRAIPPMRIYVTEVRGDDGSLGMGRATAEVFRFYHGRWWVRDFPVQPGDRIGTVKMNTRGGDATGGPDSVDYGTDWFLLDIIDDPDADKETEVERGLGGVAVLHHRIKASETMVMDPRTVASDPERARLQELVELAEVPDEVATANP